MKRTISLSLGAIQITCHPSMEVYGVDQMAEPVPFQEYSLRRLRQFLLPTMSPSLFETIDEAHTACRNQYLHWAKVRLDGILDWLASANRAPDIMAFPEGAVSFEHLPLIQSFVERTGTAVVAGTHRYHPENDPHYLSLGISATELKSIKSGKSRSVMPIFHTGGCMLREKIQLAPGELPTAEHEDDPNIPPTPVAVLTRKGQVTILPLICSEATRPTGVSHENVDLVVICSYQPPTAWDYFDGIKRVFVQNDMPVLHVNDGKYGGSEVATRWDTSNPGWFQTGPLGGKLPKGDAVLIIKTHPGNLSPRVGSANQRPVSTVVKIASVIPKIQTLSDFHASIALSNISEQNRDLDDPQRRERQRVLVARLAGGLQACSELVSRKVARVSDQLREGALQPEIAAVHCDDCITENGVDLTGLERNIAASILSDIEGLTFGDSLGKNDRVLYCHLRLCTNLSAIAKAYEARKLPSLASSEMRQRAKSAENQSMLELNRIVGQILESFQGCASLLEGFFEDDARIIVAHNLKKGNAILQRHLGSGKEDESLWFNSQNDNQPGIRRSYLMTTMYHPQKHLKLGRVWIWSSEPNAFSPVDLMSFQTACRELIPEMLITQSFRDASYHGWNPSLQGWDTRRLLNGLCFSISTLGRTSAVFPEMGVTIWHFDYPEERAYARGTAHFDYEYEADRSLPFASFTGKLTQLDKMKVVTGTPSASFQRKIKAERMGLAVVRSVPLFEKETDGKRPVGCINFYEFMVEPVVNDEKLEKHSSITDPDSLIQVGRLVAQIIQDFQRVRLENSVATLQFRLQERSSLAYNGFDTLLRSLLEILSSDAGSIFVRHGGRLECVATTGLVDDSGRSIPANECSYGIPDSIESANGFTEFLAASPGRTFRRNEINRLPQKGPFLKPSNTFRETSAISESDHRRFLGYSVPGEDGSLIGVIRLLRNARSRPFVGADEELLDELGQTAAPVFALNRDLKQRAPMLYEPGIAIGFFLLPWRIGHTVSHAVKLAASRLMRPTFTYERINRMEIDSLLQDVNTLFKPVGSIVVKLGFEKYDPHGSMYIKHFSMHMHHTHEQPVEEEFPEHIQSGGSIALRSLAKMKVHFYHRSSNAYRPFHNLNRDVRCGVCVPFELDQCRWLDGRPQKVVLSIEFEEFFHLLPKHLEALFCAVVKLSRIGIGSFVDMPETPEVHSIEEFQDMLIADSNKFGVECSLDRKGEQSGTCWEIFRVGSEIAFRMDVAGDTAQRIYFISRARKLWSDFLNATLGANQPWRLAGLSPEEMVDHIQGYAVRVSWVGRP